MALETVLITKRETDLAFDCIPATQKFHIHQIYSEYGLDEIGNPYYLGDDYDIHQIEPLSYHVWKASDGDRFEHGEIFYSFDVWSDGKKKEVKMSEAEFSAYCLVELKRGEEVEGVRYKNGNKCDVTRGNLEWIYK